MILIVGLVQNPWGFSPFSLFYWVTVGIDHRRSYIGVAQHGLYRAYVVICLQKVGGEAVPEGMRWYPLG
jgi:hypothetical protein